MFNKIMVPVDLAHIEVIEPSLKVSADMARHYQAEVCYVGVTATTPGSVARTPEEYAQKLEAFAQQRGQVHGQPVSSKMICRVDPVADLVDTLVKAIDEVEADLVVMPTHAHRHLDIVMPANGSQVASRTSASVFLVRPDANE
ncbi:MULTISPECIES: universal stress protein [Halomonas]|uniref:Universal stress protein n=2 Tax=Halomonas TaxID=2745 RepID=A0A7X5AMN7_9GAMM|nr:MULTISPECIES: universal stress protein [Halomonas]MDR5900928.1 universal stress protein [Halomonas icarae]NAW13605.1 universal stress protein [Halomonas icarae]TDB04441.1 universal stress protein [Halomonas marinisediminis]